MLHNHSSDRSGAIVVDGLHFSHGSTAILRDIGFVLGQGQTLALLGPSGCGKTTLLRMVAGLLMPTAGRVTIAGVTVADGGSGAFVPPEKRLLGMVFQDYALWPHMSVQENVSFPLEMRGVNRADREKRVRAALERVGLGQMGERRTSDMSGGQQQRVAIARAIVAEPRIVLFDEPLSNLDRELRESMVSEIGDLVANLGLTAIYVTHDQAEAFSLAHQVAVMRAGVIEQMAPPEELVSQPLSAQVADFLRLGCVAAVERRDSGHALRGTDVVLRGGPAGGEAAHVLLPSKAVRSVAPSDADFHATVLRSQFRGDGHLTTVRLGEQHSGQELTFLGEQRLAPGEQVGIALDSRQIRWFA